MTRLLRDPPASGAADAARLVALQQSAGSGNAAVARVLARQPAPTAGAVDDQTKQAQAQATAQSAQNTSAEALARANKALEKIDLLELRRETGDRITRALTNFTDALRDVRDSVKAAANADAAMLSLVLDIGMGFLAPGLARRIASLAEDLPQAASKAQYAVALAAMNTDLTKQLFGVATKGTSETLKRNAMKLAGETNTDAFLDQLQDKTGAAFQALDEQLKDMNRAEVAAVAKVYDANVATKSAYVAAITNLVGTFQREVEPIGQNLPSEDGGTATGLYLVTSGPHRRLAILADVTYPFGERHMFVSWVSSAMTELALKRAGGPPEQIDISQLANATQADVPKEIGNEPQAPATVRSTH